MSGLFLMTYTDWVYIGLFIEGFFYGIYSGIFVMYLKHQTSKKCGDKRGNIIFYSLSILYVLSVALVAMDIARVLEISADYSMLVYATIVIPGVLSGCCDFIGQSILIYRCWIVWDRNIRVVVIPLILTVSFLVLWLVYFRSVVYDASQHQFEQFGWGNDLTLTSIAMTLAVNAIMTGLIVFKIFKIYCEVKPLYHTFGAPGGSKLRPVIFIIIESGMVLFCIQLARLVLTFVWTQVAANVDQPIITIHQMLSGITPTIIQVRVSMGFSFHDEKSMVEITSGLHFGSDYPKPIPEVGDGVGHRECRDNGIGVHTNFNIEGTCMQ